MGMSEEFINATELLGNLHHALHEVYPESTSVPALDAPVSERVIDFIDGMHEYPGMDIIRALQLDAYTDDGVIVFSASGSDEDDGVHEAYEAAQAAAKAAFIAEFKPFLDAVVGTLRSLSNAEISDGYVPQERGCYRTYVMGERKDA